MAPERCASYKRGVVGFFKMHGAGNDFVVIDARSRALALSRPAILALADRRLGIGCDQVILLDEAEPPGEADILMRIYNADGSVAGACGNATRCVADLVGRQTGRGTVRVATVAGVLTSEIVAEGLVRVDMGPPRFDWSEIPLARAQDSLHLDLPGDPAACSIGNPHATLFVVALGATDVAKLGPLLETDPLFPDRANIGFAEILAPDRIRLRVWERGAGLTLACGSGACAALVNAHRRGFTGRQATLVLDGGELLIEWRAADGHVLMTGPSVTAFEGSFDLSAYPA